MITKARHALVALLIASAAGCSPMAEQPPEQASPAAAATAVPSSPAPQPLPPEFGAATPDPAAPDDAAAVAVAAVTTAWTHDTTVDAGPHDASLRAAPYLTDELATALRTHRPLAAPGAEWEAWARHGAHTVVRAQAVRDAGQPPDSVTTAHRHIGASLTPVGRDGWQAAEQLFDVFVTLTRPDATAPWRVADLAT